MVKMGKWTQRSVLRRGTKRLEPQSSEWYCVTVMRSGRPELNSSHANAWIPFIAASEPQAKWVTVAADPIRSGVAHVGRTLHLTLLVVERVAAA